MIREFIHGTKHSYGKDIRNQDNEKSFVIEQLINTKSVQKPQTIDKFHVYIDNPQQLRSPNMDNFTNPSHDIGVNSDANSTDGMEACSITKVSRYPDENAEDSKARHSFGVSVIEADQVSTP